MLVSGPKVLKVTEGANVTINVDSDANDEMHLHGYDLHLPIHANAISSLTFAAVHSGRFTFELHHAHLELGAIEVYPR